MTDAANEANTAGTPPFDRLSPRMRQCLELVYRRRTSKEMQAELGISESTINGYLAEAMRLLGETNRRRAAEMYVAACGETPSQSTGQSSRVVPPDPIPPRQDLPAATLSLRLPFRHKGSSDNDLTIPERLGWIVALAIGLAIGLGMLGAGIRAIADLALAVSRIGG